MCWILLGSDDDDNYDEDIDEDDVNLSIANFEDMMRFFIWQRYVRKWNSNRVPTKHQSFTKFKKHIKIKTKFS